MRTPFRVMLGICPPGETVPLTFVGFSASLNSPGPRSVTPFPSISGRTMPELSHRSLHAPSYIQPLSSSAHVPTPLPGLFLPLGLKPGLLQAFHPWHVPTHMEALFRASSSDEIACASPNCCISFSNSLDASASDCAAPAFSPPCICLHAPFKWSATFP